MGADSISIDAPISLEWIACIFLVSPDGEELTWFATQEIKPALSDWLQG